MATQIRKASLEDLHEVTLLFDAYRVFYKKTSAIQSATEFLRARITKQDSEIFISVTDDVVTGFVQLYPLFSSTRMRRLWLLNDLYVDEKFRGHGISVLLIDAAKQLCRDTDACGMFLETARTNEVGNQLYPRTGFVLDDEHNYYSWDV
jgi:GNAT superfamily N-acetyltransferase